VGSYQAYGDKLTSDWLDPFAAAYAQSKGILDGSITERVKHSARQLIVDQFVEARLAGNKQARCTYTDVGRSLLRYLNPSLV
jgi:hypothetical protein